MSMEKKRLQLDRMNLQAMAWMIVAGVGDPGPGSTSPATPKTARELTPAMKIP